MKTKKVRIDLPLDPLGFARVVMIAPDNGGNFVPYKIYHAAACTVVDEHGVGYHVRRLDPYRFLVLTI